VKFREGRNTEFAPIANGMISIIYGNTGTLGGNPVMDGQTVTGVPVERNAARDRHSSNSPACW
jgi:hypothetical protein